MRCNQKVEEDMLNVEAETHYNIYTEDTGSMRVYISSTLEDPKYYAELCHKIKSAPEDSTIWFILNSPGGRLDTCTQILAAMESTTAKTTCVVEGTAASAAAVIAVAGDELIMSPFSTIMFHNYSVGLQGNGNQLLDYLKHVKDTYGKLLKAYAKKLLTEGEIDGIVSHDRELWLDHIDVAERIAEFYEEVPTTEEEEELEEELEAQLDALAAQGEKLKKVQDRLGDIREERMRSTEEFSLRKWTCSSYETGYLE